MNCDAVQRELVGFHFGAVAPDAREAVGAHLLQCQSCLRAFLALKRDLETADSEPRASPAARQRLREAVASELAPAWMQRAWAWWERPLAFGFATVAVVLAVLAVQLLKSGGGGMPRALEEPARFERPLPPP